MKTKKDISFIVVFYIGVALFTIFASDRIQKLESKEDTIQRNESIVIRVQ